MPMAPRLITSGRFSAIFEAVSYEKAGIIEKCRARPRSTHCRRKSKAPSFDGFCERVGTPEESSSYTGGLDNKKLLRCVIIASNRWLHGPLLLRIGWSQPVSVIRSPWDFRQKMMRPRRFAFCRERRSYSTDRRAIGADGRGPEPHRARSRGFGRSTNTNRMSTMTP